MNVDSDSVLDSVAAYLQHQIEEGVTTIEVSPQEAAGLDFRSVPAAVPPPEPPSASPAPPAAAPLAQLELPQIVESIAACTRCPLHETRQNPVPGQGSSHPEILFVGEAPGEDEDRQGLAFVGAAGQLLTKMIQAMGLTREDVFIANILKCRPPGNRKPQPNEMDCCLPFLKAQIAELKPKVIVALGGTAVQGLLKTTTGITRMRGQWQTFEGIDLMPTFHPAYLLRTQSAKKAVWEDLQAVLRHLGKPIPDRKKSRR